MDGYVFVPLQSSLVLCWLDLVYTVAPRKVCTSVGPPTTLPAILRGSSMQLGHGIAAMSAPCMELYKNQANGRTFLAIVRACIVAPAQACGSPLGSDAHVTSCEVWLGL